MSLNADSYTNELREILSKDTTRIFFWRLLVEDCKVFQEGYQHNASAYSLLAKQEIGKRLLSDAKAISAENVFLAEQEYNAMIIANEKEKENESGTVSADS